MHLLPSARKEGDESDATEEEIKKVDYVIKDKEAKKLLQNRPKNFKNMATGWCTITDYILPKDEGSEKTFEYVNSLFKKMQTNPKSTD